MAWRDTLTGWIRPLFYLGHNPLTLTGAVLTTSSGVTLVLFWLTEIFRGGPIPAYTGIVFFLILPAVFVLGLVLIPIGIVWRKRRLRRQDSIPAVYPAIDLRDPLLRRAGMWIAVATVANVTFMSAATYRAVHYMETVQFCGEACHSVMTPEYTAHRASSHSNVACVQCHVAEGASGFVRAKLTGVRQMLVLWNETYAKPIPPPLERLHPASEMCGQCHQPDRFYGNKLLVKTRYSDDEANTRLTTILVMKLGGRNSQGVSGIHGVHLDTESNIEYLPGDALRQVISGVRYRDGSGQTIEYVSPDAESSGDDGESAVPESASSAWRTMDCLDCHNRPAHVFQLPERAVDLKVLEGLIGSQLPYIKKKAVEVLRAAYPSRSTATERIAASLREYYQSDYPEVYSAQAALLDQAIEQVQSIYLENVFPEMSIGWGTYPSHLGHENFPGCFRCHDGGHSTADGVSITQDCEACHSVLAYDEPEPEILKQLNLE